MEKSYSKTHSPSVNSISANNIIKFNTGSVNLNDDTEQNVHVQANQNNQVAID